LERCRRPAQIEDEDEDEDDYDEHATRTRAIMSMQSFRHVYRPGTGATPIGLLLLHGTGGDEHDLVPLAEVIAPGATVVSPRGPVIENGAPRFFRRFAEGVLDIDDWREQSQALAEFVASICAEHRIAANTLFAVGYSNGANIAQGLLLLRPELLGGAVLFRPMFITDDVPVKDLSGRPVLLLGGDHDPIAASEDLPRIAELLQKRGASVTVKAVKGSHGLVPEDIIAAQRWLAERIQSTEAGK
jgi:phospholipase/carboxylesterase